VANTIGLETLGGRRRLEIDDHNAEVTMWYHSHAPISGSEVKVFLSMQKAYSNDCEKIAERRAKSYARSDVKSGAEDYTERARENIEVLGID